MSVVDRILGELTAIRTRLEEAVDAAERSVDEGEEVQHEVAPPREELQRQLRRLMASWNTLRDRMMDVEAGGGSGDDDSAEESAGAHIGMDEEIRRLKRRLADFEEALG